jgi:hypothetical protein
MGRKVPRKHQRILKNEEEVAGINADLADFLQGMKISALRVACVNAGGRMRGMQPVCGQLWTQKNRQMSAASLPMEGLGNSREEAALSGIVDVLSWRHALETSQDPNCLPPGQRVVVYLKFLDKLNDIMATEDIRLDPVQRRLPAYEAILMQSMTWPESSRPIMLPAARSHFKGRRIDGGRQANCGC